MKVKYESNLFLKERLALRYKAWVVALNRMDHLKISQMLIVRWAVFGNGVCEADELGNEGKVLYNTEYMSSRHRFKAKYKIKYELEYKSEYE